MNPFSIVIPYRYASGIREDNLNFVIEYYKKNYPEAEIILGEDDSGSEEFNRGYAINNGVKQANHETLLINDGDIFIDPPTLEKGFKLLKESPFVIPWGICLDITEQKTRSLHRSGFRGKVRKLKKFAYMVRDIRPGKAVLGFDKCAGGLNLVTKTFFNKIGGLDSRLKVWGFEDTLFCFKAKNELGDYPILDDGYVCHLYHERNLTAEIAMRNKALFEDIVVNELENVSLPK